MSIHLRNIQYCSTGARSIAIGDVGKKPDTLGFLAPTWDMVTGLKKHQGIEKFQGSNVRAISHMEYVEAYRKLLLEDRVREVKAWAKTLPQYNREFHHLELYCYCAPLPANYDTLAPLTEEHCQEWFCHRLLVWKLLRAWFPRLHVEIA